MIDQSIARPYADAAYEYAKEHNQVASWLNFFDTLAAIFEESNVAKVIQNPFVDQMDFVDTVVGVLASQIESAQINFLKLLADNCRLAYLSAIAKLYRVRSEAAEGILHVNVHTAFALDEKTAQSLEKKLSAKYQKEIKMHTSVDSNLIGGMIIRVGDYVLDGSIKNMLGELQKEMVQ